MCTRSGRTGTNGTISGGANNAHAVWTWDGKLAYNTGSYGFRNEATLYDATFQPYGQIWVMNADGSGKRPLTDSMWEDGMPLFVFTKFLSSKGRGRRFGLRRRSGLALGSQWTRMNTVWFTPLWLPKRKS